MIRAFESKGWVIITFALSNIHTYYYGPKSK